VIDQAHKKGLLVAVHLYYLEDAKSVLDAGADFIAHSVRDVAVDDAFAAMLKRRDVCYCPTLMREVSTYVYESTPAWFSDPLFLKHTDAQTVETLKQPARQEQMRTSKSAQRYKAQLPVASGNLKKLSDAGVTIAMGTDTGPPARFQGYFELMELELMAKAGLTPQKVLASATRDAARCMKLDGEIGTLEANKWADFVVLDADPLFLKHADAKTLEQLKEPARQAAMKNSRSAQRYKAGLEVANRNLKKLSDAGIKIAMGTDTGPPARFQGYFELMELEMMGKAGLTPKQVLASATRDAARCQKLNDVGTLEANKWADFVVLDADPLANISNVKKINSVYVAGNRVAE